MAHRTGPHGEAPGLVRRQREQENTDKALIVVVSLGKTS